MAGRKNTDAQVAERLAAVETVMLAGEYNRATANGLADRYGVGLRQIQRDAARVRDVWREQVEGTDHQAERTDWLMRVRGAQARSFRTGHSMAAARLLQIEGQALGVYEPKQIEVTHHQGDDPAALLTALREALPVIHSMLGLPAPTAAIEADFTETTDAQTTTTTEG